MRGTRSRNTGGTKRRTIRANPGAKKARGTCAGAISRYLLCFLKLYGVREQASRSPPGATL
ncbi:hypothetical protein CGMCC3_g6379 [Colletotrichum fructicola]|nr:uncharacterized protein CGMCC3_g6379 [Colletotrichum fructicola]KAE9577893.1 hypothetical protein CGMCC3_g6379 [Colletotrichum fructicola]